MLDKVMRDRSRDKLPGELVRVYWDVLLDTEKYSTLRNELKWGIEQGPRPVAAVAQMMRGEIDMRKEQYRDALVDGFLRTIILFGDVASVQPEALYKAARCFEELGESSYAGKMRKKLLADHPGSTYSKQLMSGG